MKMIIKTEKVGLIMKESHGKIGLQMIAQIMHKKKKPSLFSNSVPKEIYGRIYPEGFETH